MDANLKDEPRRLLLDLLLRLDGAEQFAAAHDRLPELVRLLELRTRAIGWLIDGQGSHADHVSFTATQ